MRLKDKVAIVTGAGRGIGAALALSFAAEGAAVVVNYPDEGREALGIVAEIQNRGGRALALRADISDLQSHPLLIDAALTSFGRLDILVNNAAIDRRTPFLEAAPEQWDAVFAVNLRGPYFLAQSAARTMIRQGDSGSVDNGAILNIASIHDEKAHRNNSLYAIAKGGLKLMTRCLALELAPHRIRVNSLSPGAILTDMNREILGDDAYRQKVTAAIPLGRIGDASEITGAAVLLVSDEGNYITGSTFYVDGGLLL